MAWLQNIMGGPQNLLKKSHWNSSTATKGTRWSPTLWPNSDPSSLTYKYPCLFPYLSTNIFYFTLFRIRHKRLCCVLGWQRYIWISSINWRILISMINMKCFKKNSPNSSLTIWYIPILLHPLFPFMGAQFLLSDYRNIWIEPQQSIWFKAMAEEMNCCAIVFWWRTGREW